MITFAQADALHLPLADKSVDLVFGSPPYCDARTYGIGATRKCQDWVAWMMEVTAEAVRVSRGLVIWVCAGVTRDHCYWPAPEGLLYLWWEAGGICWRPAFWHRIGIPGSGGKQWLRADVEYCLCFTGEKKIPWSDNTACGHPPKWAPGGAMSYRNSEGQRRDQWGGGEKSGGERRKNGKKRSGGRPSHVCTTRRATSGKRDGDTIQADEYTPPALANPGNLVKVKVGRGLMGDPLCHENEAPFPEKLAEFFILSWCPPGGLVLDPFSGSGTTAAVAARHRRNAIGFDTRESQVLLAARRCQDIPQELF